MMLCPLCIPLGGWPATLVATSDRPASLTAKSMETCNAVLDCQTSYSTNKMSLQVGWAGRM